MVITPFPAKAVSIAFRQVSWRARRRRISTSSGARRAVGARSPSSTCSCCSGATDMWKDWIRPWVRPLPQWSTIAVAPPQRVVSATLHWDGHSVDVTTDHTVASLKPLSIATSIDAGQRPTLEYRDSATGRPLGFLHLAKAAGVATNGAALAVYHVASGEHRCLDWPRRPWNTWLQNRLMRKTPSSHHGLMQPAAVQQLMIAYLCPRPVVLVSVATAGH